jgi:pimeloyl-ACP methyl ester carboxylesterase
VLQLQHRFVDTNGIRMHIAEAGSGPLVVLLHGFPESWYSWRHQLTALADAGFHAVAPDQRGYGQTDRPPAIDAYSILHLVGDVVGLLDALGEERGVVVGHDWGAPVAWSTALYRPDRLHGVVGFSVPFRPRGERSPLGVLRAALGENFYQIYFQKPGVAEADLERDVRSTIVRCLYGASGENPSIPDMLVKTGLGFFEDIVMPDNLPGWFDESDVDFYTAEFEQTGFAGGLNWYRNIDRNWELTAAWRGARINVPAAYIVGDRDIVYRFPGGKESVDSLAKFVPNLKQTLVLGGCGHWIQQERPAEVNQVLIDFLRSL